MSLYGKQVSIHFRLETAPALVSRVLLNHSTFAVTELRCDLPHHGLTTPIAREEAYVVALQLRNYSGDLWLDGKAQQVGPIERGQITIYDLEMDNQAYLRTAFHCLQFYIPKKGLNYQAIGKTALSSKDLNCALGVPIDDPVWMQAAEALLPALQEPQRTNQLFLDHIFLALGAHFVHEYSGVSDDDRLSRGGLAPWQLALTKELLLSKLSEGISLSELAIACGLSTVHFSRAFKQSTGVPPHRWLLKKRIENSQMLMSNTNLSLHEIASACGFADQSHFSRVFSRHCGITPNLWRRENG